MQGVAVDNRELLDVESRVWQLGSSGQRVFAFLADHRWDLFAGAAGPRAGFGAGSSRVCAVLTGHGVTIASSTYYAAKTR
jgi:hypothetical protein